jgi:phosphoserine phosphatase
MKDIPQEKWEFFLKVSAIGLDSPGLISKITSKIYNLGGNIIEMEENNQWALFSIFLITDFSESKFDIEKIIKELKTVEENTDLKIVISKCNGQEQICKVHPLNYVLTILGIDRPGIIAEISSLFHEYNINIERTITIASGNFFSMEMIIDTSQIKLYSKLGHNEALRELKKELVNKCFELDQSFVLQTERNYGKMKKMIIFDLEKTLINKDSINEFLDKVHLILKNTDLKKDLPNKFQNIEELIKNIDLLEGMEKEKIFDLGNILSLNEKAVELLKILKSMGFKIALLSSGFSFFIKEIFDKIEIDYAFSNSLVLKEENLISGKLEDPIITDSTKNTILELIISLEHIKRDQIISIGNGISEFMKQVGLSIAYNPKELIVDTDGILNSESLFPLIYCLGIPKTEIDAYVESFNNQK